MNFLKFSIALCLLCCGTATQGFADYRDLASEVSNLKDLTQNPVVRQMAIGFVEKKVQLIINKKEKEIKRLNKKIARYTGKPDWAEDIEKWNAKLVACQADLKMYQDLMNQVQALE